MRREAIEFCKAGYRVIPLLPGTKRPFWDKWQDKAFSDPFDVAELWPGDEYNIGIACGHGLAVLDVDVTKGGDAAFARMVAELGELPPTRRVRTQSGGFHYYFRVSEGADVSNSAKALKARFGEGLDVRGAGGQVVAPGSTVNGRLYVLESADAIAPLPVRLYELLQAAPTKSADAGRVVSEPDKPRDIARAREWLRQSPDVYEGGRDDAAYEMACKFLDFGALATCRELLDEWNETKCNPPLSEADLDRIADSAPRNRQEPIGRDSFEVLTSAFAPIEEPSDIPAPEDNDLLERIWSFDQTEADEEAMPPRPWIAGRRLIRGKLSSLVAPGSVGKSLLTLQWACALAMGRGDWCGLDVRERCNVLVLNNEDDKDEMRQRLAAVIRHFRLPRNEIWHRVQILSGADKPVMMMTRNAKRGLDQTPYVNKIIGAIQHLKIGAFVVDPLVDSHEGNESDNGEMSAVMRTFRSIATRTNTAGLLVHHTRKPPAAASEGYAGSADAGRGATAVVNAVRISMTLFNMSPKDAERYGVPENQRHRYVRLDDAKANLFLASPIAQWFRRDSVPLPNGEESGALYPVQLEDKTAGDAEFLRDATADVLKIDEKPVTVAELARLLIGVNAVDDDSTTTRKRIVAAIRRADATYRGKRIVFSASKGDSGGTVSVVRADN